jgi:hypothetical protein
VKLTIPTTSADVKKTWIYTSGKICRDYIYIYTEKERERDSEAYFEKSSIG